MNQEFQFLMYRTADEDVSVIRYKAEAPGSIATPPEVEHVEWL